MYDSRMDSVAHTNKRHWLDHVVGQCDEVDEVMDTIASNLQIREIVDRALKIKKALQSRKGHGANPMYIVGTELRTAMSNIEPPLC